jgi:hypothetical protein
VNSNPAEVHEFLRAIKNPQNDLFRSVSKTLALCRKILRHVKDTSEYERDTSSAKFTAITRQVFPASLLDVSTGY